MAKKTFKDDINPVMSFISKESIEKAEGEPHAKIKKPDEAPKGYKLNPLYIETKNKRLQLLVRPSLHEKLKKTAHTEGTSVNELVNSILQEALEGE